LATINLPNISQGSVVTHLRYDGIFNDDIVTVLKLSLKVKKLRKSVGI